MPDPELSVSRGRAGARGRRATPSTSTGCSSRCARSTTSTATQPFESLPKKQQKLLLYGVGDNTRIDVKFRNRYGRTRSYSAKYEGVIPYLQRRHSEAESDSARDAIEGYMRLVPCATCEGARLNPLALAVTVDELNIHELCSMSILEATERLVELRLDDRQAMIAERILKEINVRLRFLCDVGLEYLSLARSAATLSGGEAQRIRLASQIGSGLVGVLYVLDEPSIGLHQRDNHKLIETLERLRDIGNTVLVVEHDEDTIKVADYVVDIGPGAGEHGGRVVHAGTYKELLEGRGVDHRPVPVGQALASRCPRCAVRPATSGCASRARASTTCATSTSTCRSGASWPSPACPARASRRWSTTSCCAR